LQYVIDRLSWLALLFYIVSFLSLLVPSLHRKKLPSVLISAGVLVHLAALVVRTSLVGHAPMANLYETLLFFSFCAALATIIYSVRYKTRLAGLISLPVACALLVAAIRADHKLTPLFLALKTIWFEIHVMASFAGYALFTIAFASAFFFLYHVRIDRGRSRVFEEMINSANVWGFAFFSLNSSAYSNISCPPLLHASLKRPYYFTSLEKLREPFHHAVSHAMEYVVFSNAESAVVSVFCAVKHQPDARGVRRRIHNVYQAANANGISEPHGHIEDLFGQLAHPLDHHRAAGQDDSRSDHGEQVIPIELPAHETDFFPIPSSRAIA